MLQNAAGRLGVGPETLTEAEESGLLNFGAGPIAFHHPLVRLRCVAAAGAAQRRLVHSAFAAVLTDPEDEDRRVWHAAACVVGGTTRSPTDSSRRRTAPCYGPRTRRPPRR